MLHGQSNVSCDMGSQNHYGPFLPLQSPSHMEVHVEDGKAHSDPNISIE